MGITVRLPLTALSRRSAADLLILASGVNNAQVLALLHHRVTSI